MLLFCGELANRPKGGCAGEKNERGENSVAIFLRKHLKKGWDY